MEEESEEAGLKFSIPKMKIMASSFLTSCQIDGERMKTVTVLWSWIPKSLWMVTASMKLIDTCFLEEKQ